MRGGIRICMIGDALKSLRNQEYKIILYLSKEANLLKAYGLNNNNLDKNIVFF